MILDTVSIVGYSPSIVAAISRVPDGSRPGEQSTPVLTSNSHPGAVRPVSMEIGAQFYRRGMLPTARDGAGWVLADDSE